MLLFCNGRKGWPQHGTVNKWLGFVPSPFQEAFMGALDVGMKLKMGMSEKLSMTAVSRIDANI